MTPDGIPEAVAEQLVIEHRDHGQRAVEFLSTARELLGHQDVAPRIADTVAYCVREALAALAPLSVVGHSHRWSDVSRRVVDAKIRYERSTELPETATDAEAALADLFRAVEDLAEFHESDRTRRLSLVESIVRRTGSPPHTAGDRAVSEFMDVLEAASVAVHAGVEADDPEDLYARAVAVLAQLYQPVRVRLEGLQALAAVEEPDAKDVARLEGLVLSPTHLQRFLREVRTTGWLSALTETGMLDVPRDRVAWPGFAAVDAVAPSDPGGVARWLEMLYDRCGGTEVELWHILRAAHDVGETADPLVRRILARHSSKSSVREVALLIGLRRQPSDAIVFDIADQLLNDHGGDLWASQEIAERLVTGIDKVNGIARFRLVAQKLSAPGADRDRWQWLTLGRGGSIGDRSIDAAHTRLEVLIAAAVQSARACHTALGAEVVDGELDRLPAELGDRIRSWLLATDPGADAGAIAARIETSIAIRPPSVDDITLLDRLPDGAAAGEYVTGWMRALGSPPHDEALAAVIAGQRWEAAWARAYEWLGVLPPAVRGPWEATYAALCAEFGTPTRDSVARSSDLGGGYGRSPFEVADLARMEPLEAARVVGGWRPDPAEFLVGTRELARTLQATVAADVHRWVTDPIGVVTALREPLHIDHYIRGITDALKQGVTVDAAGLMALIDLVAGAPWEAIPMGRRDWDYEPDWSSCHDAAVGLLRAMADNSVGFSGEDDRAWELLRDGSTPGMETSEEIDDDPLTAAINHPATRALEAAISLIAYQIRTAGLPRDEVLDHVERLLVVGGATGARIRAIVASRLGYLVHALPEFAIRIEPVLFGTAAPPGLAQLTIDMALHWDRPNTWLLERHPSRVRDAVKRGVDNALEQLLVAYLWECDGYELDGVLNFLDSQPGLTSEAGEALARMLREATPAATELGVRLWRSTVESDRSRSLSGFGWFSEVRQMDDVEWSELTLRTMQVSASPIGWPRGIAKRLADMEPTPTGLAILDDLIRRPGAGWATRGVEDVALEVLTRSEHLRGTAEYQRLEGALAERGLLD